jgi:pimeloyl-ACP methyl ester carboxylesterase
MAAVAVDYRVQGEGPPLYMVHGIGSRKVTWDGPAWLSKAIPPCGQD